MTPINQVRIGIRENRTAFLPGAELCGAAGWELSQTPKTVEVRLLWFTRGKGTGDVGVVDTVRFEQTLSMESRPFRFQLPIAPYSFSGKLISLLWAVELVVLPSKDSARTEFVLAPGGQEVLLELAQPQGIAPG